MPLLASIEAENGLRVVIVAPSQELAVQIAAEAERLHASSARGSVLLAISATRETELEQLDALFASSRPPQVLVGTPQRLVDMCRHPRARPVLRNVRTLVFDEVDLLVPPLPAPPPSAAARGRGRGRGRGVSAERRGYGRGGGPRGAGSRGRGGRGQQARVSADFASPIERRLSRKRPAELLVERLVRARPRSAPALQVVSCSATITADLRRQVGAMLGSEGKRAAGVVVSAAAAHPAPASLTKLGVGGVQVPSTIRHSAYVGKPRALDQMLLLAFEELVPAAPLLVIPNGQSVPRRVEALRALGFDGAVALQEALGVPAADQGVDRADGGGGDGGSVDGGGGSDGGAGGGGGGDGGARRQRPARGTTLQDAMVGRRLDLADAFAARSASVPLLVTTEHSARGMDLKWIDAVFMVT